MLIIRQQIKKRLHDLTPDFRLAASQKITAKIITSEIFIQKKNIACYVPIENEIDTWPIIKTIWQQGKNCYLPTLDLKTKYYLQFIKFHEHDELITTKYQVPEPKICPKKIIAPQNLDLVIIPLLGFNNDFFRLGRGAGYYDRTFEFKQSNPKANPYLLGIGYEWQRIEFKPKPWDVAMNEIVSEL